MIKYTIPFIVLALLFEPVGLPIGVVMGVVTASLYFGLKFKTPFVFFSAFASGVIIDLFTLSHLGVTSIILLASLVTLYLMTQFLDEFSSIGFLVLAGGATLGRNMIFGKTISVTELFLTLGVSACWYVILKKLGTGQSIIVKRSY